MQIKTKIVSSLTADSKPVKQEVNSAKTLSPLVFSGQNICGFSELGELSHRLGSVTKAFVVSVSSLKQSWVRERGNELGEGREY